MGQVQTDAQPPASEAKGPQALAKAAAARPRPTSPHLQVWRWHITMAGSIAHRASGVALYGGALITAGWALALAMGPGPYATYTALLGSWLGLLVLFGITLSIFYHLASGLRHLFWDTGRGLTPKTADLLTWASFAFALVASLALWIGVLVLGAAQ